MSTTPSLQITRIDWRQPSHGDALVSLLDAYALDPMGGGVGLSPSVKASLPALLQAQSHYLGWIAWVRGEPAGLINCFLGFSTFRAQPLLNIHDIVVLAQFRRQGIARALLETVEIQARQRNCCKLTLEVLEGNVAAATAYRQAGFEPYNLDPTMGAAMLFQKKFYGD